MSIYETIVKVNLIFDFSWHFLVNLVYYDIHYSTEMSGVKCTLYATKLDKIYLQLLKYKFIQKEC